MSPTTVYLVLGSLGLAVGCLVGFILLHRRQALTGTTVVAVVLACIGIGIGSKIQFRLETLPLSEALVFPLTELFSGGWRISLGLYLGLALAGLWCAATGAPWRLVGDALAIAYSVFIPIARLGCLTFGCCMGRICSTWASGFCPRFPAGSEAYNQQLRDRLIELAASDSLPAHPLPAYFAIASLLTLGVLVWLAQRHPPPGTLLAAFCILRPIAKILLEPLRANPSLSPLMTGIPLLVLASTVGIVGVIGLRRFVVARVSRTTLAMLIAVVLLLQPSPAATADFPGKDMTDLSPEWTQALIDYMKDPDRGGRALRKLTRTGSTSFPPPVQLAVADSELRRGKYRTARRLFEEIALGDSAGPWTAWAELGLGWVAMIEDNRSEARLHFQLVAEGTSRGRPVAALVVALIDAGGGWRDEAEEAFTSIVDEGASPLGVRQAAALALGYLAYWHRDYAEAAAAFDRAAILMSGGLLWDDARYGAAMARWHAGERDRALVELRALARVVSSADHRGKIAPASLDLDRTTFIRTAVSRYERVPFRLPEQQIAWLLDRDGPARARASLERMGEHVELPIGMKKRRAAKRRGTRSASSRVKADLQREEVPQAAQASEEPRRLVWLIVLGVCVVGVGSALRMRLLSQSGHTAGRT